MNFDPQITYYVKVNLKGITNPNLKVKILKLLEENIGDYHCVIGEAKFFFLDNTEKAAVTKEMLNWTCSKLKSSLYA